MSREDLFLEKGFFGSFFLENGMGLRRFSLKVDVTACGKQLRSWTVFVYQKVVEGIVP